MSFTGSAFYLEQVLPLGIATLRVRFAQYPKALSAADADDGLNPANYILSGPNTNYVTSAVAVIEDPQAIDLYLAAPLTRGEWNLAVTAIVSDESEALVAPTSMLFTVTEMEEQSPLAGGAVNMGVVNVLRKHLNPALKGKAWTSLMAAMAAGDAINWDNAKLAFNQLFLSSASGVYLDRRAGDQGLRRPAGVEMSDELFRRLAITSKTEKLTQESITDMLEVFYGTDTLRASITTDASEPYELQDGDTLQLLVDDVQDVTVTFARNEFARIGAALAVEVAASITRALRTAGTEAFAVAVKDETTSDMVVRVYSGSLGVGSSVMILGGRAQTEMLFTGSIFAAPDPGPTPGPSPGPGPSGLALWLDAGQGITLGEDGLVSQWDDQSGNDRHVTQSTSAKRFDFSPASINGEPSISSTTNPTAFMECATNLFSTSEHPFTMFVVAKAFDPFTSGVSAGGYFLSLRRSSRKSAYGFFPGEFENYAEVYFNEEPAGPGQAIITVNTFTAWDEIINPSSFQFKYTGVPAGLSVTVNTTPQSVAIYHPLSHPGITAETGSAGFTVGGASAYNYSENTWHGYLSEILVYDRDDMTTEEIDTVMAYINTKYGL